jgi:hypothetical protein
VQKWNLKSKADIDGQKHKDLLESSWIFPELQQRVHSPQPACRNEVEIPFHRGWSVVEIPLIGAAGLASESKN